MYLNPVFIFFRSWIGLKLFPYTQYKQVALEFLRSFIRSSTGSFYTLSRSRLAAQHALWKEQLPHVQPYYAVKCNPDPLLVQWLHQQNVSFDCASARELKLVAEQFGGQPTGDRLLLANPCKTMNDIEFAQSLKVPWVTVDSVEELVKMDKAGWRPNIILRMAVDDTGSSCPFGAKFGLAPEQVKEVALATQSFRMPLVGLSFHVGSGNHESDAFGDAIRLSRSIWEPSHLPVLDIGGGWSHTPSLFKNQAASVRKALDECGSHAPKRIIAEPGRFFAAPTHTLYVRVMGKKPRKGGGWRYTIDESIYGQFGCIPFDHAKPAMGRLRESTSESVRPTTPASIFGRTCDSLDWIANSPHMEELEVGDWLVIPEMGAYTTATATEFNGFPKPPVFVTDEIPTETQISWLNHLHYPFVKSLSTEEAAQMS